MPVFPRYNFKESLEAQTPISFEPWLLRDIIAQSEDTICLLDNIPEQK